MEQLIKGKTSLGKWYVRPLSWAGIWNKNGDLVGGNTLLIADTEKECVDYINGEKLKKLNKLEVIDSSGSFGEIEYILIANTEENISILKELGMTEEDEGYMIDDDESIEISYFAFNKLEATYWNSKRGFSNNTKGL